MRLDCGRVEFRSSPLGWRGLKQSEWPKIDNWSVDRQNCTHWRKMKPIVYFPIFGFLISVLILAVITRWLPREQFEVVAYGLMAFGIGMGLVAGFTALNKTYKILRPIQYWPLIGLVAAFFTKGSTWDDYWSSVFPFWIFLGFAIGLFFEWRKKTVNRRT